MKVFFSDYKSILHKQQIARIGYLSYHLFKCAYIEIQENKDGSSAWYQGMWGEAQHTI